MWDQVGVLSPRYRITVLKFFIYACILGNVYYNRFTDGILKAFSVIYPCQTQQIFLHLQRMMMLGHLRKNEYSC